MLDLPMGPDLPVIHGRGAASNPPNRFESLRFERDPDAPPPLDPEDDVAPRTRFLVDPARTIVSTNESPDVGFEASVNPYRGCEHGCAYCYARPTHEYLGMSAGLDFETRILVKPNAPELLRRELTAPGWRPKVIALSGVTDCYQPVERHLKLTRRCLEVLAELRNPAVIVTKNHLVTRDADVLADLARHGAIAVNVSVTTLDDGLCGAMEPRTSRPHRRLEAIEALARAGIPVGALVAPVIPGLTDREVPAIVAAVARAGARWARSVMLRLPYGLKDLFEDWLERKFPERKEKVLARIREVRGGKLNDTRFGVRFRGEGEYARQIEGLFAAACARAGLKDEAFPELSTRAFRRPGGSQLSLF